MLTFEMAYSFLIGCCTLGFFYGLYNFFDVISIELSVPQEKEDLLLDNEERGNTENLINSPKKNKKEHANFVESLRIMKQVSDNIREGANTFLIQEYAYLTVFCIVFFFVIVAIDGLKFWTAAAFILGAFTSTVSGFIGMYVATKTNVRVTYMAAASKKDDALSEAFKVAFKGGCVMGFCLVSLALAVLTILIIIYMKFLTPTKPEEFLHFFEYLAGYGLGGSTVALFCRVGGGIYTKAADVGADLVGKVVKNLPEDSIDNPATIADNVGDNVGDIAGMGSDLFGSFAESTCAALVVSGTCAEMIKDATFLYPLILSAAGIVICIITSIFATSIMLVDAKSKIESTLKWQLWISSFLLTPTIAFLSLMILPTTFSFISNEGQTVLHSTNWGVMTCVLLGLWSGMIIGYFTDFYTSNAHEPVMRLAQACKSGSAINIIHGLALGYLSTIIPIFCIAITIYISFQFAGMYGIALAALGMLNNLSIGLAIDAYGPISDNAGGIAEMSGLPHEVRDLTDALDAAGNTTAAIGKGFAIGSACLVSLALFGAFVTRTGMNYVNILEPIQFSALIVGAMMPYAFSALTMKSVGEAAEEMCNEVHDQFQRQLKVKNFQRCIEISTKASLREMIIPGMMVILSPLILGTVFGPKAVSGYLAGVIVSGVQMAIASSNSGGAWDNCKKFIEAGKLRIEPKDTHDDNVKNYLSKLMEIRKRDDEEAAKTINMEDAFANIKDLNYYYLKGSGPHSAAVVGDTVGDPLKDTSGPSLNILIKLSAIVSLVFGTFFLNFSLIKS